MGYATCYEAASMVIEEANRRFAPILKPNKDKLDDFKMVCRSIDVLADESGGVSYETEVDEETCDISITLTCGSMIVKETTHPLFEVAEEAKSIQISGTSKGRYLEIRFTFPGIWERTV